jgi:ATP-dependent HslUV protease ATP-binding subunit HslU
MSIPVEQLTPTQIVAELDRYIVGQAAAKRAVAIALRNRFRRLQLPGTEREDILPKNILMIGPTGVGKTEIARRLAQLARAPFVKVEATKFTEVGYVGRDVESMVRDLVNAAVRIVENERTEAIRAEIERAVEVQLAELLDREPPRKPRKRKVETEDEAAEGYFVPDFYQVDEGWEKRQKIRRAKLFKRLTQGELDDAIVEISVEESSNPFVQVFSPQGIEEMGLDMAGGAFGGSRYATRKLTVREARGVLFEQEAKRLVDRQGVFKEAIARTEESGIIFIDEIDKVAAKSGGSGPDVSREGVQRDLLPIIEGSTVQTKFGPVKTDHILFVAAGAFHISKPSDLIPELQGRLPIRVELEPLSELDFSRILREPKNALTMQYQKLLAVDGVELRFTEEALETIAQLATEVNAKTENIGARRLHTLMEKLLERPLFEAPYGTGQSLLVDRAYVIEHLAGLIDDIDHSRYIL